MAINNFLNKKTFLFILGNIFFLSILILLIDLLPRLIIPEPEFDLGKTKNTADYCWSHFQYVVASVGKVASIADYIIHAQNVFCNVFHYVTQ